MENVSFGISFIAVCVKSNWRIGDFHKKHLVGNTKFDVCVGPANNVNVVMLSTENMKAGNIKPNVTFTVEVALNINDIDFILTPNLDEGIRYNVGLISKPTYRTWTEHAYVRDRF